MTADPGPKPPPPDGVVVIDKPKGPTSHDVVMRVRKLLKTRAVGHAGTLDPMATGVLVVAVGEGTKLVPWLTAADKAYEATIRLGAATDTLDAEGNVTETREVPALTDEAIERALAAERARTEQIPPAFSAIKVDGVRSHERARKGEDVALAARPVEVRSLTLVARREGELDVRVESAKGYFVRSLARDLAAALGTVGHLTALRRVRSGAFCIEDAVALEALGPDALLGLDAAAAKALPVSVLDADGVKAAGHGQRVAPAQMKDVHVGPTAWLDERGRLVAVGECGPDGGRVLRGFPR
ncbi:MAG: tRNA pseudouridine(55) synthase TruB [Labilithrix sp.]